MAARRWDGARALELLKNKFGHSAFRGMQEEVVRGVIQGRDTLCIAATGAGKSLTFQYPTQYCRAVLGKPRSCTVVVSPLLSLMDDQCRGLTERGIRAACLNGQTQRGVWEQAEACELDMLYVTPETLKSWLPKLQELARKQQVDLIAVDEAHVVSEWGADFRPEFRELGALRAAVPGVPILALTATATLAVRRDVVSTLRLANPLVLIGSFNRPNLTYAVRMKTARMEDDVRWALSKIEGSAIIYCNTREQTERVAAAVNSMRLPLPAAVQRGQQQAGAAADGGGGADGGAAPAEGGGNGGWMSSRAVSGASAATASGRKLPWAGTGPPQRALSLRRSGAGEGSAVERSDSAAPAAACRVAAYYHAGMSPEARSEVYRGFIADRLHVTVATVAFGMGIDHPGIRGVVHYGAPKTLEGYYQQTGRAGRDGDPAACFLFWGAADFQQAAAFIAAGSSAAAAAGPAAGLEAIQAYCALGRCRRAALLHYFAEELPAGGCTGCDNCALAAAADRARRAAAAGGDSSAGDGGGVRLHDFTSECRMLAAAAHQFGGWTGLGAVVSLLQGGLDKRLREKLGGSGPFAAASPAELAARGYDNVAAMRTVHGAARGTGVANHRDEKYWHGVALVMQQQGLATTTQRERGGSGGAGAGGSGRGFGYQAFALSPLGVEYARAWLAARGRANAAAASASGAASPPPADSGPRLPLLPVPEDMMRFFAPPRPPRPPPPHWGTAPPLSTFTAGDGVIATPDALGAGAGGGGSAALFASFSEAEMELYQMLVAARAQLHESLQQGPGSGSLHAIATERMLRVLAKARPLSAPALLACEGMTQQRVRDYGERLLQALRTGCARLQLAGRADAADIPGAAASVVGRPAAVGLLLAVHRRGPPPAAAVAGGAAIGAAASELLAGQLQGLTRAKSDAWDVLVLQGASATDAAASAAAGGRSVKPDTLLGYVSECVDAGYLLHDADVLAVLAADAPQLLQLAEGEAGGGATLAAVLQHRAEAGAGAGALFAGVTRVCAWLVGRLRVSAGTLAAVCEAVQGHSAALTGRRLPWVPAAAGAASAAGSQGGSAVHGAESGAAFLASNLTLSALMQRVQPDECKSYSALKLVLALLRCCTPFAPSAEDEEEEGEGVLEAEDDGGGADSDAAACEAADAAAAAAAGDDAIEDFTFTGAAALLRPPPANGPRPHPQAAAAGLPGASRTAMPQPRSLGGDAAVLLDSDGPTADPTLGAEKAAAVAPAHAAAAGVGAEMAATVGDGDDDAWLLEAAEIVDASMLVGSKRPREDDAPASASAGVPLSASASAPTPKRQPPDSPLPPNAAVAELTRASLPVTVPALLLLARARWPATPTEVLDACVRACVERMCDGFEILRDDTTGQLFDL